MTIFGIGAVAVVGVGSILIGAVLMLAWWLRSPDFFAGRTLNATTGILVLDAPGAGPEPTVIAPDFSNLPTGSVAVDEETGKRFRRTRSRRDDD